MNYRLPSIRDFISENLNNTTAKTLKNKFFEDVNIYPVTMSIVLEQNVFYRDGMELSIKSKKNWWNGNIAFQKSTDIPTDYPYTAGNKLSRLSKFATQIINKLSVTKDQNNIARLNNLRNPGSAEYILLDDDAKKKMEKNLGKVKSDTPDRSLSQHPIVRYSIVAIDEQELDDIFNLIGSLK